MRLPVIFDECEKKDGADNDATCMARNVAKAAYCCQLHKESPFARRRALFFPQLTHEAADVAHGAVAAGHGFHHVFHLVR